jgi:hypothetical protein
MTADPLRLARVRRLHRVQASLAEREEMRRAALEASRLALLARETETVARFDGDGAFGAPAGDLARRLAALAAQRRAVEDETERQRQRLAREKGREAVVSRRLALLDAAAADRAQRAELNDIVEARLGRALVNRKDGDRTWRSN